MAFLYAFDAPKRVRERGLIAGILVVTERLDHVIERAGHMGNARRRQELQQAT
jgi:hypothetical protein